MPSMFSQAPLSVLCKQTGVLGIRLACTTDLTPAATMHGNFLATTNLLLPAMFVSNHKENAHFDFVTDLSQTYKGTH